MFEWFGISSQALFGQLLIGLINGSFYALLSLGLAVIFGMLNIINFAHGAQYMMGAFAAFLLLDTFDIGYWPALARLRACRAPSLRSCGSIPSTSATGPPWCWRRCWSAPPGSWWSGCSCNGST